MNLLELGGRFTMLTVSILILYFFSNKKHKQTINPFIVIVGLCTFSLCFLFTKIEIGVGIGFGLFAIFSILRFRTQAFTIIEIIFLFVTITLSILDALLPAEKIEILFFFQLIILCSYAMASLVLDSKSSNFKKSFSIKIPFENVPLDDETSIKNHLSEIVKLQNFDFKILKVNTILNELEIEIYF